ncbi:3-hydroxyacyl-[acyl-carrier-protein] dehydratase FabZ [Buchnera aphidicola]|uniref:3-hydroxyacyl-[acyl-carrier-protein] dehydratase FabZ n=1 Tax=Buchnera aphidicola TaxID=9 RepID=UPI002093036C|nr:3-hydroxyacyl-[acyl-carrier-protein] dehydratase FabZ [Buchnera aphidicola]USS94545.1 3-hydroxyacyl-[acyl-carrier-protein] dehydratase FabZ [Buchnera aphidicola (Periphyllus lyropictus)]
MSVLKFPYFLNFIPHRDPFLFVDKVKKFKKNTYLFSEFFVHSDFFFFLGHFPKKSIFPGVLILESIMQSSGILIGKSISKICLQKNLQYLTYIKKAKFKRLVFPNSKIKIKVFFLNRIKNFFKFQGYAFVKNFLVCEVVFTIYLNLIN